VVDRFGIDPERLSEEERRDLWGRNANRVYRLGLTL
jgi:hypothetical protein